MPAHPRLAFAAQAKQRRATFLFASCFSHFFHFFLQGIITGHFYTERNVIFSEKQRARVHASARTLLLLTLARRVLTLCSASKEHRILRAVFGAN